MGIPASYSPRMHCLLASSSEHIFEVAKWNPQMIKPLRKYHYMIWRLWAILLPIGFVIAIVVRPAIRSTENVDEEAFTANIAPATDSTSVITILVGKPIQEPSCVVILSSPQNETVLGTLNRQGRYNFIVPTFDGAGTLNLVDAIRQKKIANIPLSKNNNAE